MFELTFVSESTFMKWLLSQFYEMKWHFKIKNPNEWSLYKIRYNVFMDLQSQRVFFCYDLSLPGLHVPGAAGPCHGGPFPDRRGRQGGLCRCAGQDPLVVRSHLDFGGCPWCDSLCVLSWKMLETWILTQDWKEGTKKSQISMMFSVFLRWFCEFLHVTFLFFCGSMRPRCWVIQILVCLRGTKTGKLFLEDDKKLSIASTNSSKSQNSNKSSFIHQDEEPS